MRVKKTALNFIAITDSLGNASLLSLSFSSVYSFFLSFFLSAA